MSDSPTATRRRGARAAKRALRAAPLAEEDRAVRPGMSGGGFQPLADADVLKVNEAVMDTLETIGLSQAIPSCIDAVTKAGGTYKDGRLYFPRSLVEDTIANCARDFVLHGQDPKHDMHISGNKVYFGTAGAAVHIVDIENKEYRESHLKDLYDMARLVDQLDHIHYFQRCLVARDVEDPVDMDFNTSNCFVVPPLRFAEDACACMEVAVHGGMPVLLLAAGQAGATSPAALAGSVVQEVAEVLAGLVWVNLMVPKHPAMWGTWPFKITRRTIWI